ncbi:hypothetical protein AM493_10740 [Flavobacterium akiainvivens]|uniref:Uncharacterized protein n=1 Tax=Flavobacterium akiainvivens TaxID=1202724 RepID=A0A0M9VIJ5_9FLAO|nr:hypothetical protein [Flavobacterium akiainvivens]KOS06459.1 hypothetical protein AM493_10740 [Flavobacterium akiainvivens]SFQ13055.1 hypothetical protein SAMN05444144_101214 [Flavobacterium akiainvivens]
MKKLLFILLSIPCYCQQLSNDAKEIATLELNRVTKEYPNKRRTGDTLFLYRQAAPVQHLGELKKELVENGTFTAQEANDIFGVDSIPHFKTEEVKEWTNNMLFENRTLKLINSENKSINPKYIGVYKHWLSVPVIRQDRKYAFIFHSIDEEGGYVDIFIFRDKKWSFFRSITLFII